MSIYYVPCYVTIRCNLPIDATDQREAEEDAEDTIEEYMIDNIPESCSIVDTEVRSMTSNSYRVKY